MIVEVSAHAADRFAERVRPGLSRRVASDELARLVREFGREVEWPAWVPTSSRDPHDAKSVPVEISDGVIVVMVGRKATTVLTRAGRPEGIPHRGQKRRKARRAQRASGTQAVAHRGRPDLRPRRWDADAA